MGIHPTGGNSLMSNPNHSSSALTTHTIAHSGVPRPQQGSGASIRTAAPGGSGAIKKKKSAFGWLKKALSLDEEERAEFEARRRATNLAAAGVYDPGYMEKPAEPLFIDGKRVRPRGSTPTPGAGNVPR